MTILCDIAFKYRTDKCPKLGLSYTPFYWEYFKDKRDKVKKVFEFGIGSHESMDRVVSNYTVGASLYMWRDFFPNALVYGADISPKAQIKDKRIKTFVCDETDLEKVKKIIKKVGFDIDLFVDDAYHQTDVQVNLFKTVFPLLKKGVLYVIEDVNSVHHMRSALSKIGYSSSVPTLDRTGCKQYKNNLVVIRK